VGFSFGSLVSGLITADHPELVKRLVLVAPPALGMKSPPLALQSLGRKMSAQELEASVRHNLKRLMLHRPGSIDDMAVALHAANFERDRLRLRRLARTSIMSELQLRWRCPVHAVWGREDTLARQDAHRLSEVLSGCDLRELVVIDDAGHWVQYEEPAQFNAALLRLLATPA
jgi:pimeloyl-ACP methyl ester carboxylesterase